MRHALCFALAAVPAISACAVDEEAPELSEIEIVSFNALAPDAFLDNGDALHALAGEALDGATTPLVDSEPGRMLLSYVVRCALDTGDVATFPRAGAPPLVFTGLIGIAEDWMDGPLDTNGQRLMTACLMGHVSAVGTQFPISVRSASLGNAPLTERLLFPAQEMAVYGNYLGPASQRELYVCFGQAVAQSLGGSGGLGGALGLPTYLDFRVCSVSEGCGFERVGACYRWSSIPGVRRSACEIQSGSTYRRCHERPIQEGGSPSWNQTVSIYLQPADLALVLGAYVDLICDLTGGQLCELLPLPL